MRGSSAPRQAITCPAASDGLLLCCPNGLMSARPPPSWS
jgi:hypothetical protein